MSASLLASCVSVLTRPGLCPTAQEPDSASPTLCTEYGPDGWMDKVVILKLHKQASLKKKREEGANTSTYKLMGGITSPTESYDNIQHTTFNEQVVYDKSFALITNHPDNSPEPAKMRQLSGLDRCLSDQQYLNPPTSHTCEWRE